MIKMQCGLPGSGKSYDTVVNCLIPALREGRIVWTNLEGINFEYLSLVSGVSQSDLNKQLRCLSDKEVKLFYRTAYHRHHYLNNPDDYENEGITWEMYVKKNEVDLELWLPSNAYVVIDEVQNYWGAKDYAKVPQEFDHFLSMHRHYGLDIIFITQRPARVYKEIQRLTEYIWMFEKMSKLGLSSRYKAAVRYADDRKSFKRVIRKYDSLYFPCYKSYSGAEVQENKGEKATLFATWQIVAAASFVLFFGYKFANMRWFTGVQPNEAHASVMKNDKKIDSKVRAGGGNELKTGLFGAKSRKTSAKTYKNDKKRIKKKKKTKNPQEVEKRNFVINGLGWSGRELVIYLNDEIMTLKELGKKLGTKIFRNKDEIIIGGKIYAFGDSIYIE